MAVDDKFLRDIGRSDVVERKAITQVMNLSKTKIDDVLWSDDSAVPDERRRRDFRIVIGDMVIPFEVKADFMSSDTGNIALEYRCNGKQSGVAGTGSAVWVHMVPFGSGWRMYFAKVSELRKNLMLQIVPGDWRPDNCAAGDNYVKTVDNRSSGDSNPSMNMLLRIDEHVQGKPWWKDSEKAGLGSVDWRLYIAV